MINKPVIQILKTLGLAFVFITTTFILLSFQAKSLLAKSVSQPHPNREITSTLTAGLTITGATTVLELFSYPSDLLQTLPPTSNEALLSTFQVGAAAVSGEIMLSQPPAFSSDKLTTTFSMDWGDVERDGDLDLAIGSISGTAVFLNEKGVLSQKWLDNTRKPALEVRWFALDNDDNLELVVVGDSIGDQPSGEGQNYIYTQPEQRGGESLLTFTSTVQLVHVAPGDYDGNGKLDLLATTNLVNPPDNDPIRLYQNISDSISFENSVSLSKEITATASIAPADFDNDGDLDLALSQIQSRKFGVLISNTNAANFSFTPIISNIPFPASDAAWGDYDSDGFLDLAVAFPISKEVRIYRNQGDRTFASLPIILPSDLLFTPLTIDWADFNNDGHLDLAVAEIPPKIYAGPNFDRILATPDNNAAISMARISNIRGIDLDNDLDLDLALTNEAGPSLVFTASVPPLSTNLTPIDIGEVQSVAWGDADGDSYLDLLFGGRLYLYSPKTGEFGSKTTIDENAIAGLFGEVITDSDATIDLDILLATPTEYKLYKNNNGNFSNPADQNPVWRYSSTENIKSMALGYFNNDWRVDILLGNGQDGDSQLANLAFLNDYHIVKPIIPFSWSSRETGQLAITYDLAWADYNQDGYLDYAAANGSNGIVIYRNNKDLSFSQVQTNIPLGDARAVAWADYNADAYPDLAVGYFGAANRLYKNETGSGIFTDQWNSNDNYRTISLAWADWDNDDDLDLAVGNVEQDQIFDNVSSLETPNLKLFWKSSEIHPTTDLAWGDKDGDGDLDLAVSHLGAGVKNGVYENHTIWPSQLGNYTQTMPLPRNTSYVVITRPGTVPNAYSYSSGELIGYNPFNENSAPITIPIHFQLFDPDGSARGGALDTSGDPVHNSIKYEYSLDGGSSWNNANPAGVSETVTMTKRNGASYTFIWRPPPPEETTENALFRITVVPQKPTGPVQRAKTTAVSPPFRLRADNCNWPANPSMEIEGKQETGHLLQFLGDLEPRTGEGEIEFLWNFDDGNAPRAGILRNVRYDTPGQKTVVLTVSLKSDPCDRAHPVAMKKVINIAETSPTNLDLTGGDKTYLPLIFKSETGEPPATLLWTDTVPQVTQLQGRSTSTVTHLVWSPLTEVETVLGYRIYRGSAGKAGSSFELLATVPVGVNQYSDFGTTCEHFYFVTAYNAEGESDASSTSYYSPICAR